jgi:hypothetical protein
MASKTTSYTHEINGFGVVKGEQRCADNRTAASIKQKNNRPKP